MTSCFEGRIKILELEELCFLFCFPVAVFRWRDTVLTLEDLYKIVIVRIAHIGGDFVDGNIAAL